MNTNNHMNGNPVGEDFKSPKTVTKKPLLPETTTKKHTLSLLVANKPGVLIRVALVFARRGYNIDSLVVSEGPDPSFSTMNIVARGDQKVLDQILKQLNKLVDVITAHDRTGDDIIQHELALFKLRCNGEDRTQVLQLSHALDCEITDITETTIIIQAQGPSEKLDSIASVLKGYGIIELVRTGKVLMARGEQLTSF